MTAHEPVRTFEAARRRHLIEATIDALADVGFKAASLSEIARRADVSTGLFAHYFGDKDGLLEATLRFMAARLTRATVQRLRAATSPRERLLAVANSALADEEFDRRTSAVWLAFWGQITHSTRYQRVQVIYQRRMLSNLRDGLRHLVSADDVDLHATMIAAMIDGVWIRSHASPNGHDAARARSVVRALIDTLVGRADAPPVPNVETGTGDVRQADVEDALARARAGAATWRSLQPCTREAILRRCADALRADAETLARLDALSSGRPVARTMAIDVPRSACAFEQSAALTRRPSKECIEHECGRATRRWHRPLGIVGLLERDDAPPLDLCRRVAPALALGNAVIAVPASRTAAVAARVCEILEGAGLPEGMLTLLHGGAAAWRGVDDHADVTRADDAAPDTTSATIVLEHSDPERAASAILRGGLGWTRSPHLGDNRIYVQRGALDPFKFHLLRQAETLRIGDPLDPKVHIGPMRSEAHLAAVLRAIARAVELGATLLRGGIRADAAQDAPALALTILETSVEGPSLSLGGLDAPILLLTIFDREDEVVHRIDRGGAPAMIGVFAPTEAHAERIVQRFEAVACWIGGEVSSAIAREHEIPDPDAGLEAAVRRYTRTSIAQR